MRETAYTLAALRASLSKAELPAAPMPVPLGHPYTDFLLQGGLRTGALHEIFAEASHEAAASGFAAALVFRIAGEKTILWIRQDACAGEFGEIAPTGFVELGLDPSRLLLLRAPGTTGILRAAGDALACAALGAVVLEIAGESKALDLTASQRLTRAAARCGVTAFALRFNAAPQTSTAETRWHIRGARSFSDDDNWGRPLFEAHLARNRHGGTGRFLMEWTPDHGVFQEPAGRAPNSGVVVSSPGDGPAATKTQSHSARLKSDTARSRAARRRGKSR